MEVKKNISFPKLAIQDDLVYVADKLFIPMMKNNIDKEVDLREKKYSPLAESTIKSKKRYGLSQMILQATGKLRNSFRSKKKGKYSVLINLNSNRAAIGNILQNEGVRTKTGLRFFNFFGISSRMERDAVKYMRNEINKRVKSGK